ncbi:PP2C family protein-serine/threonine phosphatase [Pseudomonas batumici]|uniref:Protein serine/threonine phosphatase PrpC, regulation of stationary phase n=1 Tax=Pseudomonas batumici TaxID=226910 RepID=A0A0C2I7F3_9PSED|nr:PP2C family serine/threonine-protein phosphatase [Pseudomonas batumici]KIH82855.1 Protein serine/threonine phosphatase PrpC, regulation of stationary phase [Pseudomonas batumici]
MAPSRASGSAGRTDPGKVRPRNEDAFLDGAAQGLWVVADGLGGHQSGDIASRLIVNQLAALKPEPDVELRSEAVRRCLHWLNRRLTEELTLACDRRGGVIGSTVVALLVEEGKGICIWAGDSRCYLWRDHALYQLSKDHSLRQQRLSTQAQAPGSGDRQSGDHALTRAVGAQSRLTLEVLTFEVRPGDVFLLCSDGLYQSVDNRQLSAALALGSARRAVDWLFDCALAGTAMDNLTAVVVRR